MRMRWAAPVCLAAALAGGAASAACRLQTVGEFKVDLSRGVPLVDGVVDDTPVKILIDTGSNISFVVRADAQEIGAQTLGGAGSSYAIGGRSETRFARIKSLRMANFTASNLMLFEAGPPDVAPGAALVLGEDFLAQYDIEFDYPDGVIRLFTPDGCAPEQLDYWNKPYSLARLAPAAPGSPGIRSAAMLNGQRVEAELDSGSAVSLVDATVASAVGGVVEAGSDSEVHGLGEGQRVAWVDHFKSFAYGDETIGNVRLKVLNLLQDFETDTHQEVGTKVPQRIKAAPYLLLGSDFLRAHRVYVGVKEQAVVFSYVGGPVFGTPPSTAEGAAAR